MTYLSSSDKVMTVQILINLVAISTNTNNLCFEGEGKNHGGRGISNFGVYGRSSDQAGMFQVPSPPCHHPDIWVGGWI
jgi:hypothetical protein